MAAKTGFTVYVIVLHYKFAMIVSPIYIGVMSSAVSFSYAASISVLCSFLINIVIPVQLWPLVMFLCSFDLVSVPSAPFCR